MNSIFEIEMESFSIFETGLSARILQEIELDNYASENDAIEFEINLKN